MAKENLTIEDLRDMELHVLYADVDKIILSDMGGPEQFIVLRPSAHSFEASFLKEVKTKS